MIFYTFFMFGLNFKKKIDFSQIGLVSNEKTTENVNNSKISSQFKGDVEKQEIKVDDKKIEKPPFNDSITEGLYIQESFVTAIVDKIIDFVWGPGLTVNSKDDRAQAVLRQWLDDVDFDFVGRKWLKEALVKRGGFLELGGKVTEVPQGIKVLDAKRMFIERNNKGKIIKYWQQKAASKSKTILGADDFIQFNPEKISPIFINNIGDIAYGYGIIWANVHLIDNLISLETDMTKLMKRKANSPIVATLGDKALDLLPTEDQISAFGGNLQYMNNKTEWAVSDMIRMQVLDFGKIGEKFQQPIDHTMDRLYAGFQVPEVLMGQGNIPEGLAAVQSDTFDRRIVAIRKSLDRPIEKIFERILKVNKLDTEFTIEWGGLSDTQKNTRIDDLTILLNNQMLSPGLREEAEKELAILLGIDPNVVETPEEERDREETEQAEPRVPGSNGNAGKSNQSLKKKVKCDCSYHKETNSPHKYDEDEDFTVKEWLDFNYDDYLDDVINVTKKDKFIFLAAATEDDIKAGLFTATQTDTLRDILKDGFENNKTIREISNDIKDNIDIKDRLRTKDHKLVKTKDGDTILALSAQNRPINIARTETVRLANKGAKENYKKKDVEEFAWVTTFSDRTCPVCEELNGQIFSINSDVQPPRHNLCRCTTRPVTRLD